MGDKAAGITLFLACCFLNFNVGRIVGYGKAMSDFTKELEEAVQEIIRRNT